MAASAVAPLSPIQLHSWNRATEEPSSSTITSTSDSQGSDSEQSSSTGPKGLLSLATIRPLLPPTAHNGVRAEPVTRRQPLALPAAPGQGSPPGPQDTHVATWVPRGPSGPHESTCQAIGLAFQVALSAAQHGVIPSALLHLVSPYRAHMDVVQTLGRGGFGAVVLARSRLDHRFLAIKTVRFWSPLPPWTPPEALEAKHARMLREVRALSALSWSPYVVRYHHAWIESDWQRLGAMLATQAQQHPQLAAFLTKVTSGPGGMFGAAKPTQGSHASHNSPRQPHSDTAHDTHNGTPAAPAAHTHSPAVPTRPLTKAAPKCTIRDVTAHTNGASSCSAHTTNKGQSSDEPHSAPQGAAGGVGEISGLSSAGDTNSSGDVSLTRDHTQDSETDTEPSRSVSHTGTEPSYSGDHTKSGGLFGGYLGADFPTPEHTVSVESVSHDSAFTFGAPSTGPLTSPTGTHTRTQPAKAGLHSPVTSQTDASLSHTSQGSHSHTASSHTATDTSSSSSYDTSSSDSGTDVDASSSSGVRGGGGSGALQLVPFRAQHWPPRAVPNAHGGTGPKAAAGARAVPGTGRLPGAPALGAPPQQQQCSVFTDAALTRWPYVLHISMEPVAGLTLDQWLARRAARMQAGTLRGSGGAGESGVGVGLLGVCLGETEKDIFWQVVEGLWHVHTAGIMHRDVKPSNIFVTPAVSSFPVTTTQHTLPTPHTHSHTDPPHSLTSLTHGAGHSSAFAPTPFMQNAAETGAAARQFQPGCSGVSVKIGDFGLSVGAGHDTELFHHSDSSSFSSQTSSARTSSSQEAREGAGTGTGTQSTAQGPRGKAGVGGSAESGTDSAGQGVGRGGHVPGRSGASDTQSHTSGVGTASYAAPEQQSGTGQYDLSADLYPLGLILLELILPFQTGMERAMAFQEARRGSLPPSLSRALPQECDLIRTLLSPKPAARPTCQGLLNTLRRMWCAQPNDTQGTQRGTSAKGGFAVSHNSMAPHAPVHTQVHIHEFSGSTPPTSTDTHTDTPLHSTHHHPDAAAPVSPDHTPRSHSGDAAGVGRPAVPAAAPLVMFPSSDQSGDTLTSHGSGNVGSSVTAYTVTGQSGATCGAPTPCDQQEQGCGNDSQAKPQQAQGTQADGLRAKCAAQGSIANRDVQRRLSGLSRSYSGTSAYPASVTASDPPCNTARGGGWRRGGLRALCCEVRDSATQTDDAPCGNAIASAHGTTVGTVSSGDVEPRFEYQGSVLSGAQLLALLRLRDAQLAALGHQA